jgi:hypothetical protein
LTGFRADAYYSPVARFGGDDGGRVFEMTNRARFYYFTFSYRYLFAGGGPAKRARA